jgi:hypothetical protein
LKNETVVLQECGIRSLLSQKECGSTPSESNVQRFSVVESATKDFFNRLARYILRLLSSVKNS